MNAVSRSFGLYRVVHMINYSQTKNRSFDIFLFKKRKKIKKLVCRVLFRAKSCALLREFIDGLQLLDWAGLKLDCTNRPTLAYRPFSPLFPRQNGGERRRRRPQPLRSKQIFASVSTSQRLPDPNECRWRPQPLRLTATNDSRSGCRFSFLSSSSFFFPFLL
jgi:hypothetical protein